MHYWAYANISIRTHEMITSQRERERENSWCTHTHALIHRCFNARFLHKRIQCLLFDLPFPFLLARSYGTHWLLVFLFNAAIRYLFCFIFLRLHAWCLLLLVWRYCCCCCWVGIHEFMPFDRWFWPISQSVVRRLATSVNAQFASFFFFSFSFATERKQKRREKKRERNSFNTNIIIFQIKFAVCY